MATSLTVFRHDCEAPQTSMAITFTSQKRALLGKWPDCLGRLDWAVGDKQDCSEVQITLPRTTHQVFIYLVRNDPRAPVPPSTTAASLDSYKSVSIIQKHSRSAII